MLRGLASIHCTYEEISRTLDIPESTIRKGRYRKLVEKAREQGKQSLRRAMWVKALAGNVTLMIWLSKNHLQMTDVLQATNVNVEVELPTEGAARQELSERLAKMAERLRESRDAIEGLPKHGGNGAKGNGKL